MMSRNPDGRHYRLQPLEPAEPDETLQCDRQRQYAQWQVHEQDVEASQKPDELHQAFSLPRAFKRPSILASRPAPP